MSTLHDMQERDVVVVGAGAMGSAAAWWLARRGRDVTLLERFEAGHTRGSSHGVVRIFRLAYPDLAYTLLALDALPLWRELEADTGETLLDTTGALDHGSSVVVENVEATLVAAGVRHERLHPDQAAERFTGMRFDTRVVYQPDGGRAYADRTLAACQRRAAELGAEVRFNTGTAVVEPFDDHVLVHLPDTAEGGAATYRARVVVVSAGAWVAPTVGGAVTLPPLTITQEQVQHYTPTSPDHVWPSFLHDLDPFIYGLFTPGEGMKVAGHHWGEVTSGDDRSFVRSNVLDADVRRYVERWFPGLVPEPHHEATCLYTSTANEDFVLDRVGPVVVASPCSGHGFKFTPVIGRIIADLADGVTPSGRGWEALASRLRLPVR